MTPPGHTDLSVWPGNLGVDTVKLPEKSAQNAQLNERSPKTPSLGVDKVKLPDKIASRKKNIAGTHTSACVSSYIYGVTKNCYIVTV